MSAPAVKSVTRSIVMPLVITTVALAVTPLTKVTVPVEPAPPLTP